MRRVALRYGTRAGWAYLRELRGDDEESIGGCETWSAIALLDRLLVAVAGAAVQPGEAIELCAADRDRLLATIYRDEVGARIAASPCCPACDTPFDIDFTLDDLVASVEASTSEPGLEPGTIVVGDAVVRIPTGIDELAASQAENPLATLTTRCAVRGELAPEQLADALAAAAPLIDLELDVTCPTCRHTTAMAFNIQNYLLGALLGERTVRAREIHLLARSYGWSLSEIQSLPRARRRMFVDIVDREARLR